MTSQKGRAGSAGGGAPRIGRRALLTGAAALGVGASLGLAGCGGGGGGRAMQFWQDYAPNATGEPQLVAQSDWYLGAIAAWNDNNPQQIEPLFIPNYVNPMNPRVATAFAGDNGPDIFLLSPGEFLRYYNGGVLTDLRPYMSQEAVDDFYPQAIDTRRVGEAIYSLPIETDPLSMYYDVAAFEQAGLSEGDLPTTWEAMLDVAERLTTPLRSGLVFDTAPGYYQNFTFYPFIWQGGGDVVDPATQRAVLDGEPVQAALAMWGESIARGVAPRTMPPGSEIVSGFRNGLAAMWQRGPWSISEFRQQAPDYVYDVFPLPTPPGGQQLTAVGGWAWAVNNRGQDPDAAARFVVESLGSMTPESIERCAGWSQVKNNLPARRSVTAFLQGSEIAADPVWQKVLGQLETGRGEPRFPPTLYKALSNAIQSVQLAGGSPSDQAGTAQAAVESFLLTYEGGYLV